MTFTAAQQVGTITRVQAALAELFDKQHGVATTGQILGRREPAAISICLLIVLR